MTWSEIIAKAAERLGECRNKTEFEAELDRIEASLAKYTNAPDDFWDRLQRAYSDAPKLLLKEAQASAALNALLAAAQALIRARAR